MRTGLQFLGWQRYERGEAVLLGGGAGMDLPRQMNERCLEITIRTGKLECGAII